MLQNPCPWTAAATALEEHTKRAWGAVHDARHLATIVDPVFEGVIASAQQVADNEIMMAESMAWARDFMIEAAQHPEAFQHFRDALAASVAADEAERGAVRVMRRARRKTMPVGGATVVVLDRVRGAR